MASSEVRARIALCLALFGAACTGTPSGTETDGGARDAAPTGDAARAGDTGPIADGSAPQGDAARADGGTTATPSCPSGAILCESFEDGTALDTTRWRSSADDGVFVLDATTAADGARSLHMRYGQPYGATGEQTIVTRDGIAAPGDRVYVRAYLRFGDLSLPGAHPFFITAFDGDAWLAFGSIINDFALMAVGNGLDNPQPWYEGGTGMWHPGNEDGDDTPLTENGLNAGEWFCVEVMAFGGAADPDTEEATVSIDGVPIADMVANDERWGFPAAARWSPRYDGTPWAFGVESFGPDNVALDIWFDAIVISNEPIGCASGR